MTLTDYIEQGIADEKNVEGFTINNGKKVYWYITPMPRSGLYRCLPIEADQTLGWPRWIPGNTTIKVAYKRVKNNNKSLTNG